MSVMTCLKDRAGILCFLVALVLVGAVVDESEDYARFFNEPQTMLRTERHHQRSVNGMDRGSQRARYIKGSSNHASGSVSSSTNTERLLQDFNFERKEAPTVSKDNLRLGRYDWRSRLVLSHHPSSVPSESPSLSPSSSSSPTYSDSIVPGQLLVGAYYYPWHSDDFHRGYGYLREDLEPPQMPELGEYDDRDSRVIRQHLRWSRQANINLWITSWWGPNSRSDNTTRNYILNHESLRTHKISVFYETQGRILESEGFSLRRVEGDMEFLCDTFFKHPNYYYVNDVEYGRRPVLFVYLSRSLDRRGLLRNTTELMRRSVRDFCGKELYLVGDHVFGGIAENELVNNATDFAPFRLLDAVTNYDVYGSMAATIGRKGGTLTQPQVQNYYENEQAQWKNAAESFNCQYIPSVSAGYNDLSVRPRAANPPLSRSLVGGEQGSLFREALKYAVPLADNSGLDEVRTQRDRLLMVNSFNEWHEDTQIEPVAIGPLASSSPMNFTFGITYESYGDRYLDILREATEGK